MVSRLRWRSTRLQNTACAEGIAAALDLAVVGSPDPRMGLWYGRISGAELWLATGAHHRGPNGRMFEPAGPCFVDGMPPVVFGHLCNVLLVTRHAQALPARFSLSSAYGIQAGLTTGDRHFDQRFKLNGVEPEAVRRLFGDLALRDELLGIFGPDGRDTTLLPDVAAKRQRNDTGVVMWANEQGMAVHWGSPREAVAAEFGRAVARAGSALATAVRHR